MKLFVAMMISMLFVMPVFGQAKTITINSNESVEVEEVSEVTEVEELVKADVIAVESELEESVVSEDVLDVPHEAQNLINKFTEHLANDSSTTVKYTSSSVNIRKYPSLDAEIVGCSQRNDAFDVVVDIDGWSMIALDGQYLYMKSDWFVDAPIVNSYTEEDLEVLTRVLTGECHTYPDQEQLYVGSVVLNRVKDPSFPNTIKGVVFQKGQYACTWDGNYYREPTERNRANAKWLLENGSILPDGVVYQSGFKQGKVYLKTKYHYFCYK